MHIITFNVCRSFPPDVRGVLMNHMSAPKERISFEPTLVVTAKPHIERHSNGNAAPVSACHMAVKPDTPIATQLVSETKPARGGAQSCTHHQSTGDAHYTTSDRLHLQTAGDPYHRSRSHTHTPKACLSALHTQTTHRAQIVQGGSLQDAQMCPNQRPVATQCCTLP